MGATLSVFPLISVLKPFNLAPFWKKVQEALLDEDEEEASAFQVGGGLVTVCSKKWGKRPLLFKLAEG
jgi:hypothetical protein